MHGLVQDDARMNTTPTTWQEREDFVRSIARKHRSESLDTMVTEVELTWDGQPHLNFRMFKSDGEWLTIKHRATQSRGLKIAGLEYEITGERDGRHETLTSALGWIALHYDREIEKMMEAGK